LRHALTASVAMFHKILVATDKSPLGDHVFSKTLSLAKELKASLMLLHVLSGDEADSPQIPITFYSPRTSSTLDRTASEIYQKQWEEFEQKGLDFLRSHAETAKASGVTEVEFTQNPGNPGRVICELAQNWNADLIAVGRRGRSGLSELVLGSVSNYVLHHAPCEVLIIHAPAKTSQEP
jgi:nucleotide-binding universal stress UspA family protein